MRRPLGSLGAVLVAAGALAAPGRAGAAVPVVVIDGRGWGHGVGLAQDGALAMGRQGASTGRILEQFYPGTRMGRAGGEVRVVVAGPGAGPLTLAFPGGGEVRDARGGGGGAAGFPVAVPPGGRVAIAFAGGRYRVESPAVARPASARPAAVVPAAPAPGPPPEGTTTTSTAPPLLTLPTLPTLLPPGQPLLPPLLPVPTTPPPPPAAAAGGAGPAVPSADRPLWAVPAGGGTVEVVARGQRYRGVLEATGGPALRLVNHVDVEQYLRGMGEVRDPRWPAASLRAQAVAARTYALRAVGGGGELCDSQRCQVYLGSAAEYAAMDRAVAATRGQVLVFGRSLASTVYSANGGGVSATPEEGFGTSGDAYPYLRASPYPTGDPLAWTVRVSLRDLARRLGYRGQILGVRATAVGESGRVVQVTVEGDRGTRTVSGLDFDRALALRSTFFTVRTELADRAPPAPPPAEGPAQLLPDQAAGSAGAPAEPQLAGDAGPAAAEPAPVALTPGAAAAAGAELAAARPGRPGGGRPLAAAAVAGLALATVALTLANRVANAPGFRRRRQPDGAAAGP